MKKTVFILLIAFIAGSFNQKAKTEAKENTGIGTSLKVSKIEDPSHLPSAIQYEGNFKDGIHYSDKSGEHIVVLTEKRFHNKLEDNIETELFAYHFNTHTDNSISQTWKVYDFFKGCVTDVVTNFLKNTFQATDLNNDGIAEIWLVYIHGCKGDISPWNMKIIMYQGQQKFAMRGRQKVKHELRNGVYEEGGEFKFDNAFNNGPKLFRDFAEKLWNENMIENRNVIYSDKIVSP